MCTISSVLAKCTGKQVEVMANSRRRKWLTSRYVEEAEVEIIMEGMPVNH